MYRILADENVEQATVTYLRKLGHDIEVVGEQEQLPLGCSDREIVDYCHTEDRLILTQDIDFVTDFDPTATAGVLFQRDQTLSSREVGDVVHELSTYLDQEEITLEYVTREWL